jgi:hypothetical protein
MRRCALIVCACTITMMSVARGPLEANYAISQLDDQEDRLAVLRRESADLEQRRGQAHGELAGLIEALALDVEVLDAAADGADTPVGAGEAPKRQ